MREHGDRPKTCFVLAALRVRSAACHTLDDLAGRVEDAAALVVHAVQQRRTDQEHGDPAGHEVGEPEPHGERQGTDSPERAVPEVRELSERTGVDQVDGHRTHVQRADAQPGHDQGDDEGERERAHHTVEREHGILELQVAEREERRLAGQVGQSLACVRGVLCVTILVLVELAADPAHRLVEDDTGHAGDEHCSQVVGPRG